jgi:hypothetical protein
MMHGSGCAWQVYANSIPLLRLMAALHARLIRRGYTAERYRRIIDSIRRHMPDASVSGDAIVGFPGETVPSLFWHPACPLWR